MRKAVLVFVVLVMLMMACNTTTSAPADLLTATSAPIVFPTPVTPSPSPQPTATPTPVLPTADPQEPYPEAGYGPDNFPPNVNPLTGQLVEDPSRLERRPVSVKINNYPRSNRPQWGLSVADIVYEYYHNNELPRFHAIFYGEDADFAGPIRSARMFDDYLVSTYKSILAFASADFRVMERLQSRDYADRLVYLLDGDCPPMPVCRFEPDRSNFLLADTEQLGEYIEKLNADNSRQGLNGMSFQEERPPGSSGEVERIYIRYSYAAYSFWEYEPNTQHYYRHQDTQEDLEDRGEGYEILSDRLTEEAIRADNVVVLVIPHFYTFFRAATDTDPAIEVVDMEFVESGAAYAFRDGRVYELEWNRPSDGSVLYLSYPDGERFPFKPGQTWFQVVSDLSLIEEAEEVWRFQFAIR